jgi:excisionase family DNA binding protein
MTNDDTHPDRLLRPDEVATRLGVSERTLERWRATGQGPAHLVLFPGRIVRYRAEAIVDYLATLTRRSES